MLCTLACTYLLRVGANAADEEGLGLAQRLQQLVKRCLGEEGMHMDLLPGAGLHCCVQLTKGSATPAEGAPQLTKDSFGVGSYTGAILQG